MSLGEEERIEQEFTQGICKGGKTSLYDTTTVVTHYAFWETY